MAEESLITEEMKAAIGVESEPSVFEIEKEAIRRWAEAVGDNNPIYYNETYAKNLGYKSIVAPPGFLPNYDYPVKTGKVSVIVKSPFARNLNGGDDFTSYKPIQAGDIVYMTKNISDLYEREGKIGKMFFIVTEYIMRNETGDLLAIAHHTQISY